MNRIIPLALSLVMGIMGCIGAGRPAHTQASALPAEDTTFTSDTTASITTTGTSSTAATKAAITDIKTFVLMTEATETTVKTTRESTTEAETVQEVTEAETQATTQPQTKKEKQTGSYAWPADPDAIVTAGYPSYDSGAYHGGVDIALYDDVNGGNISEKTAIYAAKDGVVVTAFNDGGWNTGFGNHCIIDHGNGVQTLYAHASEIHVSEGDTVRQGQLIGLVGDTGNTTAPHLHFEVRVADDNGRFNRTNPLKFISEP